MIQQQDSILRREFVLDEFPAAELTYGLYYSHVKFAGINHNDNPFIPLRF